MHGMRAPSSYIPRSVNSNDAIHISLVNPEKTVSTFHPKFTYSIFGDEESIFGYQGLKINLRYNSSDMRPVLQVTYNKKYKPVGDVEPTDVKGALEEFLPKTAFEKVAVFDAAIKDPSYAEWSPPGELLKTVQGKGDESFEIWKGSLADVTVKQLVKRIQILVPFFIEGGTMIDLDDTEGNLDRWTVFFLYKKTPAGTYEFVGYSTVYRYFLYQPLTRSGKSPAKKQRIEHEAYLDFTLPLPKISFSDLPCRSRISQFIILPPYQGGGNGSRFYNAIFDYYLEDKSTMEITVEDPNEAFDDMRDLNDLARLRTIPEFKALRINKQAMPRHTGPVPQNILDVPSLETLRTKLKIAPRQFFRVVEMQLLSLIHPAIKQSLLVEHSTRNVLNLKEKKHEYHLWQLWVKKRLYKHNKDTLIQLDRTERIEKLEQALGGVEADYARLLRAFDDRAKASTGGKRALEEEGEGGEEEHGPKKAKLA
ncbi:Histone acetyltransferase type B catalytic subunit [Lachnellula occidentalis]|uniref:Histone acetyltransferase type B catalytic subunit n=1 Tax=Lachnellula occidentalis TaxID=215460 RepID=A0A8H8U766_9HELO|nr:Histone acetyltransferase type B catalytic subunit [Lachnellula occidentalis]